MGLRVIPVGTATCRELVAFSFNGNGHTRTVERAARTRKLGVVPQRRIIVFAHGIDRVVIQRLNRNGQAVLNGKRHGRLALAIGRKGRLVFHGLGPIIRSRHERMAALGRRIRILDGVGLTSLRPVKVAVILK